MNIDNIDMFRACAQRPGTATAVLYTRALPAVYFFLFFFV